MIAFLLKFTLTNILFSLVIGLVLVKLNKDGKSYKKYSNFELLLYSLGLGPIFTVLILYFLLMLTPGYSNLFYLAAVLLIYLVLLIWGRKSISLISADIKGYLKLSIKTYRTLHLLEKIERVLFVLFLSALLVGFLFLYLNNTLQTPLEGGKAMLEWVLHLHEEGRKDRLQEVRHQLSRDDRREVVRRQRYEELKTLRDLREARASKRQQTKT